MSVQTEKKIPSLIYRFAMETIDGHLEEMRRVDLSGKTLEEVIQEAGALWAGKAGVEARVRMETIAPTPIQEIARCEDFASRLLNNSESFDPAQSGIAFHHCSLNSPALPELRFDCKEGGRFTVSFQSPPDVPPFEVPCADPQHTQAFFVKFDFDHYISGDHSHDDGYWNHRENFQAAAAFIVDTSQPVLRHVGTIAAVFPETIEAKTHNLGHSSAESLSYSLIWEKVYALIEEIKRVNLNGKTLDEAAPTLSRISISGGRLMAEVSAARIEETKVEEN